MRCRKPAITHVHIHVVAAMEVVAALAAVTIQVIARLEDIVMGGIVPARNVNLVDTLPILGPLRAYSGKLKTLGNIKANVLYIFYYPIVAQLVLICFPMVLLNVLTGK